MNEARVATEIIFGFAVRGKPIAQPRPRFSEGHAYNDPGPIDAWKDAIRMAVIPVKPRWPIMEPVFLDMAFHFSRTGDLKKKDSEDGFVPFLVKPDIDNLVKAVMDALQSVNVFKDDAQVVSIQATKLYTVIGGYPGLICHVNRVFALTTDSDGEEADPAEVMAKAAGPQAEIPPKLPD